ncbi:hypothetical protein ED28_04215 [[Pantoea] beijingensis]|uniref:DUF4056 domain-containing protein n=1 Tax=[Pantoea] beijingensis TaxID=1324864 RepID=A0A443IGQ7_9GAMM|nr:MULTISPECIES: DUF4056 domain-containing protein [Erwiniaceae]RWR03239.1 hypothetical protein ED28_04215 [[Pantoea] beijingensis]
MKLLWQLLFGTLLLIASAARAALPIVADLSLTPQLLPCRVWPVVAPLPAPDGLRPCCAFGYNLKARLLGIPVPFYTLDNVIEANKTGTHHYNHRHLTVLLTLAGINDEKNGLIYTHRGGFIDSAHVRDTADMTLFIFSHIWPMLGQPARLALEDELASRKIVLFPLAPPTDARQGYAIAAWLSASLAFQVAAWHEIAQWYGYQSVPGFPEGISAFSPEDLYSNLLGARLAVTLILRGQAASVTQYNAAMSAILPNALAQLNAVSAEKTRFMFDMLDGVWWNSRRRIPDKFLLLRRNYDTSDERLPTASSLENSVPLPLRLPQRIFGYTLDQSGELRLYCGKNMKSLPHPATFWHWRDFATLASMARIQDKRSLAEKMQHAAR